MKFNWTKTLDSNWILKRLITHKRNNFCVNPKHVKVLRFLANFLLLAFELFPCLEINRLIFVRQRGREINTWMFAAFSLTLMLGARCDLAGSNQTQYKKDRHWRPPLQNHRIWCFFTKIHRVHHLQNHRNLMFFHKNL